MKPIYKGRYTALTEEGMVVFLVGMRINQWWAVHKWWPVFIAMKNMLDDLQQHSEKGMQAAHTHFSWREIIVTTYWQSYEQLEDYARNAEVHLSPWKAFNKEIGASGCVGIWHETFVVAPQQYECVYVNMPIFGLAQSKSTRFVKAEGTHETSRLRMGGKNRPAVPSPATPDN